MWDRSLTCVEAAERIRPMVDAASARRYYGGGSQYPVEALQGACSASITAHRWRRRAHQQAVRVPARVCRPLRSARSSSVFRRSIRRALARRPPSRRSMPMVIWVIDRGHEFGSVTGRPRRCGWFDVLGSAIPPRSTVSAPTAMTKLDVLDALDEIPCLRSLPDRRLGHLRDSRDLRRELAKLKRFRAAAGMEDLDKGTSAKKSTSMKKRR